MSQRHSAPATGPARRRLLAAAAAVCLALGLVGADRAAAQGPDGLSVSLEAARAALADGRTVVIDIREPREHATGVAAGMRLLPMSQIGARLAEIPKAADQPVLLICNTQNRSRRVVEALRERGWTQVRYVHGGMSSWAARGWPMVAPPR
ncbi:MAG: rhodanese-like domain-containing protein [Burkholderiaceae bacterium]|nr:rhodanese-like domain-containing protein [Burkholderiaceae bacterium]